jgi:hypothetical protein
MYYLNATSGTHSELVANSIATYSRQNLLNLTAIDVIAYADLQDALLNLALPISTNVTTESGASAAKVVTSLGMVVIAAVLALIFKP